MVWIVAALLGSLLGGLAERWLPLRARLARWAVISATFVVTFVFSNGNENPIALVAFTFAIGFGLAWARHAASSIERPA
jgi:membrane protease YdiL (CAAX protease family)